jgi:ATP-dependent Lon protease
MKHHIHDYDTRSKKKPKIVCYDELSSEEETEEEEEEEHTENPAEQFFKVLNQNRQDFLNKIGALPIPENVKSIITNENMDDKRTRWLNSLFNIPFNKYTELPPANSAEIFIQNSFKALDDAVYGLKNVKEEVINYIAQIISMKNASLPSRVIALEGLAGVGKTKIIRDGLYI